MNIANGTLLQTNSTVHPQFDTAFMLAPSKLVEIPQDYE
jgi:hypothetical protein